MGAWMSRWLREVSAGTRLCQSAQVYMCRGCAHAMRVHPNASQLKASRSCCRRAIAAPRARARARVQARVQALTPIWEQKRGKGGERPCAVQRRGGGPVS